MFVFVGPSSAELPRGAFRVSCESAPIPNGVLCSSCPLRVVTAAVRAAASVLAAVICRLHAVSLGRCLQHDLCGELCASAELPNALFELCGVCYVLCIACPLMCERVFVFALRLF